MRNDTLNVNVCYEHPKDKSLVQPEMLKIIVELSEEQSLGHLCFEAANGYYYDRNCVI